MTFYRPVSSASSWNASSLTYAAFEGRRSVRIWEVLINYNNSNSTKPQPWWVAADVAMGIIMTLGRASFVFSPEDALGKIQDTVFERHLEVIVCATLTLAAFNAIAVFREQTNKKVSDTTSRFDTLLIVVWKATPYLMLITNIALIIFDIPSNKVIGLFTLGVAGITLIDLTSWKPKSFSWYLDVGVRVPVEMATMYYHEQLRLRILVGWVMNKSIQNTFFEYIKKAI